MLLCIGKKTRAVDVFQNYFNRVSGYFHLCISFLGGPPVFLLLLNSPLPIGNAQILHILESIPTNSKR